MVIGRRGVSAEAINEIDLSPSRRRHAAIVLKPTLRARKDGNEIRIRPFLQRIEVLRLGGDLRRSAPTIDVVAADGLANFKTWFLPLDAEALLAHTRNEIGLVAHLQLTRSIGRQAITLLHKRARRWCAAMAKQVTRDDEVVELNAISERRASCLEAAVVVHHEDGVDGEICRLSIRQHLFWKDGECIDFAGANVGGEQRGGSRWCGVPAIGEGASLGHAIDIVAVVQRRQITQTIGSTPAQSGIEVALCRGVRQFHRLARCRQHDRSCGIDSHATDDANVGIRGHIELTQFIGDHTDGRNTFRVTKARAHGDGGPLLGQHHEAAHLVFMAPGGTDESRHFFCSGDRWAAHGTLKQFIKQAIQFGDILAKTCRTSDKRAQ